MADKDNPNKEQEGAGDNPAPKPESTRRRGNDPRPYSQRAKQKREPVTNMGKAIIHRR